MPAATKLTKRPVVLIVRDGWGRNPNAAHDKFNSIKLANTPKCSALLREYPWTLIHTSGEDVGLPDGTMGNSEVGHQNIGAGRIVYQESMAITVTIREGTFFENATLVDAVKRAKVKGGKVHVMGIGSDVGVHGVLGHLYACLELCKRQGVAGDKVFVHLFTDGRDSGPYTGKDYVEGVVQKCREIGVGRVVSLVGRYYAMDRDNRWERVERAYGLLVGRAKPQTAEGVKHFATAAEAIQNYYENPTNSSQQGDEFITPRTIGDDPAKTRIGDGDTIIFFNYRGDRPREITRAFLFGDEEWSKVAPSPDSGKHGFDRGQKLDLVYCTMTAYETETGPVRPRGRTPSRRGWRTSPASTSANSG